MPNFQFQNLVYKSKGLKPWLRAYFAMRKSHRLLFALAKKRRKTLPLPQVALVYISPSEDSFSDSAIEMDTRVEKLKSLAPKMGFQIAVIQASDLLKSSSQSHLERLKDSQAIWWCGRMASQKEITTIHDSLKQNLASLVLETPIYDSPQSAEESDNLSQSY